MEGTTSLQLAFPDGLILETASTDFGSGTAVFDPTRRYRYRLTRRWDTSSPGITWVMLNPSTADARSIDPTIRRVVGFSADWGYGSAEIVNLFASRTPDPRELRSADDPIGPHNDAAIEAAASCADVVVIAWGNRGALFDRAGTALGILSRTEALVVSLGRTRRGHPPHPLYLRRATTPSPWGPDSRLERPQSRA